MLSDQVSLAELQDQVEMWEWALIVFVFYFCLETLLMLIFLGLIYSQMKGRRSATFDHTAVHTPYSDLSESTFSVSKVFSSNEELHSASAT